MPIVPFHGQWPMACNSAHPRTISRISRNFMHLSLYENSTEQMIVATKNY
jgi:hypothetical protein